MGTEAGVLAIIGSEPGILATNGFEADALAIIGFELGMFAKSGSATDILASYLWWAGELFPHGRGVGNHFVLCTVKSQKKIKT